MFSPKHCSCCSLHILAQQNIMQIELLDTFSTPGHLLMATSHWINLVLNDNVIIYLLMYLNPFKDVSGSN